MGFIGGFFAFRLRELARCGKKTGFTAESRFNFDFQLLYFLRSDQSHDVAIEAFGFSSAATGWPEHARK